MTTEPAKIPQISVPWTKPTPTLAQVIIDRIREGASLEETKEYYRFLREIQADEAKLAFDADFVQLKFPEIPKLGRIGLGGNKGGYAYARWEDINDKIEPVLQGRGFKLRFDIEEETDTSITIAAILQHRGGHSIKTRKKLPLDKSGSKNIVQAYGSTQSYGQRYSAIALLNLTSRGEDDDATGTNGPQSSDDFFITVEQIAELERLIALTGRTPELFCKKFRLDALGHMATSNYSEAVAFLKTYVPKAQP